MKTSAKTLQLSIVLICLSIAFVGCINWKTVDTQKPIREVDYTLSADTAKPQQQVIADPLNVKEYTLENGLRIFISQNKAQPRIQTLVLVKAGSVQDPEDATGLAHYLEHMLFKGNDKIGTVNYEKENVEITKIKDLFENLKASTDSSERQRIYHLIDSVSGVAAMYACPNEIDQLFTQIGAKGTNAYTSNEFTGYINNIPANQLDNWLKIESERYQNPVLRLFHTELEAVYEEKNISLDKASRRTSEVFAKAMYPNHNYGKQTTIGTIEHLKSPSMYAIEKFFATYYVPNNMAIFLSGDIDPDSAYALINARFKHYKAKEVPKYFYDQSHKITAPVEERISSKEAPQLTLGFRFPGAASEEAIMIDAVDMLLANSTAGLIDININQSQKAIGAYSYTYIRKDYSAHILGGQPNDGETLESLRDLLLLQIDRLKKGDFEEWMLEAVINDLKKRELTSRRSNKHRVSKMSSAFAKEIEWTEQIKYFNKLSAITKADLVKFVNDNYHGNYVAVYRTQEENTKSVQVEKPTITPIESPRSNRSKYLLEFSKNNNPAEIPAVFVEYSKEIAQSANNRFSTLNYQKNTQDSLFTLSYVYPFGSNDDKYLSLAFEYAQLCGTKTGSLSTINKKWYELGIDFTMGVGEEECYFSISGLATNMEKGIKCMQERIEVIKADSLQMIALKGKVIQLRKNSLKNKRHILWTGLKNYLVYGNSSPYLGSLTNQEIEAMNPNVLLNKLPELEIARNIFYYGPDSIQKVESVLPKAHFNKTSAEKANKDFIRITPSKENEVYFFDFEMKQAEILLMHNSQTFSKELQPVITLFNEYYGGGMSSIVFQEIREKKALAYSVYAGYTGVKKAVDPHYVLAYIGTQADKYEESMEAMLGILNKKLPYDSLKFEQAKAGILQKYASDRIAEHSMIAHYRQDKKLGYDYDKRKDVYDQINKLTFADIESFFNEFVRGSKYRIAVMGDSKIIDLKKLSKYGKVKQLDSSNIFPY